LLHACRHCSAQREGGTDVDRENTVPIGVRHLLDGAHLLFCDAAGIVDEHIDKASRSPTWSA
jgi:hypothetical protein